MNLCKLYLDLNQNDEALKELAIVYNEEADLYYNAYLLGRTYYQLGEDEKAIQILQKFANEQKQASQIANQLFSDGLVDKSIYYYGIAMGDEDIRSKTLYQRAQAFKELGQKQEALDDLLALIEVVPRAQFFYEIAMLYVDFENYDEVCFFLDEAKKRDQPDVDEAIQKYCPA